MSSSGRWLWHPTERKCLYLLQQKNTRSTLPQIHAFMLRLSIETIACASLSSLAGIVHARRLFDVRPHRDDTYLCNSMIKSHLHMRQFNESFTLFRDLRRETYFTEA
ncbi:hypothetical protein SLA2020_137920 [Shorea laevis]